ncbi:MAG: hypothetical protein J7J98_07540 [candidate division Zixibacteria bacterium]|nr:hypothetical protein [candidate division Zixibacteria bacterium]
MRQRVTYFSIASVALIVVWYFAVFTPMSAKLESVRQTTVDTERRLEDYNRTGLELPKFLEANKNLEFLRSELNSSLFAKSDILDLFRQLSQDAQEYGLELVELSPPVSELLKLNRQAIEDNEPQFLNVQLDLKGQYIAFGKFVEHLETQPYFRSINNCMIRGTQESRPTVDMTVAFRALLGSIEEQS